MKKKANKSKQMQAVLIALSVVFILSLASVYGQSNSKNMMSNGNMGDMMNGMDNMDDMMKDMGMSDEMIQECQDHMKSGKMGDMMNGMTGGMSQEEHESHHK